MDLETLFQDSDPALKALLADVGALEGEETQEESEAKPVDDASGEAAGDESADDKIQEALLRELGELKEALAAKQEKAAESDDEVKPIVPDLDDEALGNLAKYRDRLEQIAQVGAAKGFKPVVDAVNEMRQQLAQIQSGVTQQQEALAQQVFVNALRAQVPDIDELYKSREFTEFLAQPAPLSNGKAIGELLEEAHNARDVGRIVEIIKLFRERHGGSGTDPYMRPDVINAAPGTPGSGRAVDTASRDMAKLVDARRRLRKLRAANKITDLEYEQAVKIIQRKEDDILRRADSFADLMKQIA